MTYPVGVSKMFWSGQDISSPMDEITIPCPFDGSEKHVGLFILGKFDQFGCAGHKHIVKSSNLNVVHWCTGTVAGGNGIGCRVVSNYYPNGVVMTITYQYMTKDHPGFMGAVFEVGSGKSWFTMQNLVEMEVYWYYADWSSFYGGNLRFEPLVGDISVRYPQTVRWMWFYNRNLSYDEVRRLAYYPENPPKEGLVSWIDFQLMKDLVRGIEING